jgi:hypothetical protein
MSRMISSFLLLLLTLPLFAEEHSSETSETKSGKRLAAEGKIAPDAVKFLSTHFYKPEEIIRADYEKSIPDAIEKAIQNKDEGDISKILADLVATTNPVQAEAVIKDARKEIEDETKDKDPGKFDTRYVALMERLVWAAMNRNGEFPDSDKAKDFNDAFKDPYTKARDFNKEANEKLKQAAEGNQQAREWVDKNVRKSTLLSLAEGQRITGNKKLSDTMIKGVSFKTGDQRVLDMWGPGKEPQRLYLGSTDESASKAIDGFLSQKKSFGGNAVSRKELPNDGTLVSWYINDNGEFTKGFPKGYEPKAKVVEPPKEQEGGGGQPTIDGGAQFDGKCIGCHASGAMGFSSLGAVKTRIASGDMPKGGTPLTAAEQQALLTYLQAQGLQ